MKTPTGIRKGGALSRSMSRSAGRSFWATGMFLKEHLWAWPLIAAALPAALGVSALLAALGVWFRGESAGASAAAATVVAPADATLQTAGFDLPR